MKKTSLAGSVCLLGTVASIIAIAADPVAKPEAGGPTVEKGRHLVKIAGCNDCHTPGYGMSNGKVPEREWLTGDSLGWRGPWGTSYPQNLRLFFQTKDEDDWVEYARNVEMLPPMPWANLREMTDDELRSIYKFIRGLGPAGKPAPAFVASDKEPNPPFVQYPSPPPPK